MAVRKEKRKRRRRLRRIMRLQFLIQIPLLFILLYFAYGDSVRYYVHTVKELHEEAIVIAADISEEDFKAGSPGVAYAADGTVISEWRRGRNVCYVALSEMPQAVVDAMICMEDQRFYEHHGVDYLALMRAALALIRHHGEITQGGSTISMQLARSIYLTQETSWQRKVEEIFIARELEKKFSKDQIMEFYLNNIYFGNGYYGIGTASQGYFGKPIAELSLAQLMYLCAIPNNPAHYNPLTNGGNTEQRTQRILKKMLDEAYISKEDYLSALAETIVLSEPEPIERNDYVQTYTTYCAVRALMERSGFTFCYQFQDDAEREAYEQEYAACYAECQELLYTEGYQVYTSLDLEIQQTLQNSLDWVLVDFTDTNENGVYTFQGAAVCIDNETGRVKAIVGGRTQEFDTDTLNRGFQSFRQPGSAIKPLIVYTPLFERAYTPDMLVMDGPIAGGPRNATRSYEGWVTIRHAVEESLNTVAWKLFGELTPEVGLSYLTEMEFSKIVPEDNGLPSALGGLTIGVSPLEMASAFAAIANGGIFRSPTCVVRILDADGRIVYAADDAGKRVYTQEAVDTMNAVLAGVMENGTGEPVRLNGIFCAGKTGTTDACKDSWFVGYTAYYTTSVWVGYDMPKEIAGLTGPAYSGFIWKNFMEAVHNGLAVPEEPAEDGAAEDTNEQDG